LIVRERAFILLVTPDSVAEIKVLIWEEFVVLPDIIDINFPLHSLLDFIDSE